MLTIDPSILNFALLSNSKVDLKLALPVDKKGLNISLKDISKKVYIHKKKYIHTPFPLIENENIYWSSIHHMRDELSIKEINLSLVNIDMNYINQPEKIKEVKLKKISNDSSYKKIFAEKIISEYLNNRSKNKSFSLSRNRFTIRISQKISSCLIFRKCFGR